MRSLLTVFTILFSMAAKADTIPLITLTSEAQSGKVAHLGVEVNEKNEITALYYKGGDGKIRAFAIDQIKTKAQVIYSKSGYSLVYAKLSNVTGTQANLTMTYVKNVFGDEIGTKKLTIKFNPSLNSYELLESGHKITEGYVTTHRNYFGVSVGIDEIETQ